MGFQQHQVWHEMPWGRPHQHREPEAKAPLAGVGFRIGHFGSVLSVHGVLLRFWFMRLAAEGIDASSRQGWGLVEPAFGDHDVGQDFPQQVQGLTVLVWTAPRHLVPDLVLLQPQDRSRP